MNIEIIPMPFGDCFILQWNDSDGTPRLVVLDSGTSSAYRSTIRQRLRAAGRDIDLWVISHAHRDHIGGAIKFVHDINMPACKLWCINGYQPSISKGKSEYDDGSVATSAADLVRLTASIGATGSHVCGTVAGDRLRIGDAHFYVLSPTPEDVERANSLIGTTIGDGSIATSTHADDYSICIGDFDIDDFTEDSNTLNRASIAMLIEHNGKRFLWLADSVPSVVCASIRKMGYDTDRPLECAYSSLAHHGSRGNTNSELLSLVETNNYIITSNAQNIHNLPHKAALACLLRKGKRRGQRLSLIFPCGETSTKRIFSCDGDDVFTKYSFDMDVGVVRVEL